MEAHKDYIGKITSQTAKQIHHLFSKTLPIKGLYVIGSLLILGMTGGVYAQPNMPSSGQVTSGKAISPSRYPMTMEITTNDLLVRSGPGTNFYSCGKVNSGDTVSVVGEKSGWTKIIPPPGSFSWISMPCVVVSMNNPSIGVVTGDDVGVYAGSDLIDPMHSPGKQVTLKRGSRVRLLGEEKNGYFKIMPPQGCFLWVSSKFVRPVGSIRREVLALDPNMPTDVKPKAPVQNPVELQQLNLYYKLQQQVQDEVKKPLPEQDYSAPKKALADIQKKKEAGKAARYAEYLLNRIAGYELAIKVTQQVKQQEKALASISERIQTSRIQRLSQITNLGRYAVMGKLESSTVYKKAAQVSRYRIMDMNGTILCYAQAAGNMIEKDMSPFLGKQVGLIGTIKAHAPISHALVEFTDLVVIE